MRTLASILQEHGGENDAMARGVVHHGAEGKIWKQFGNSHCPETARGSPMRGTSASRHSIACKMKNRLTMNHKVSAIAAGMRNQCSVKSSWS